MRHRPPVIRTINAADVTWQELARCAGTDSHMWFPTERGHMERRDVVRAKSLCGACPVVATCLEWALEIDDRWAILGGMLPDERARIRRKRRDKARAS